MMNRERRHPAGTILLIAGVVALPGMVGCGGRAARQPVTDPVAATRIDPPSRPARLAQGFYHRLQPGQTLYSLARTYDVPLDDLMRANGIVDPTTIPAGRPIFIPGAVGTGRPSSPDPSAPVVSVHEATALGWPLEGGITSRFGPRARHSHHDGIDIDGRTGDTVRAAAAGYVVRAASGGGYGRTVIIDHGGGLTTLYGHASRLLVRGGDRVERGDPIAEVGRSGNARGSHLHFETRRNGHPVDPLPLLRQPLMEASAPAPSPAGGAAETFADDPILDEDEDDADPEAR